MLRCCFRPLPLSTRKLTIGKYRGPLVQTVAFSFKPTWTEEEIDTLIKLYDERLKVSDLSCSDKQTWREVSSLLEEKGIHKLASQCRSKWRRLRHAYESAKASGTESQLPHHEKLEQILNSRSRSNSNRAQMISLNEPENKSSKPVSIEPALDEHSPKEANNPNSSFHDPAPAMNRSLASSRVKSNDKSLVPPGNHELAHKLVELLRSQLEFQNLIYRNIIEEFQKSRREEYQLRSEILATLKEMNLAKNQNSKNIYTNECDKTNDNHPPHQAFTPQPLISSQSLNDGIDIFEADENLRTLRENLCRTDVPNRDS